MAHAQKPDLVFQREGRVHLNRRGCQFSRLLAAEECGSAYSECIDRVPTYTTRLLATHSIRIFPLRFLSRASQGAIRFRTRCTSIAYNREFYVFFLSVVYPSTACHSSLFQLTVISLDQYSSLHHEIWHMMLATVSIRADFVELHVRQKTAVYLHNS